MNRLAHFVHSLKFAGGTRLLEIERIDPKMHSSTSLVDKSKAEDHQTYQSAAVAVTGHTQVSSSSTKK